MILYYENKKNDTNKIYGIKKIKRINLRPKAAA